MAKRKRTEDLGITFGAPNGEGDAEGWLFGIPWAFHEALDILYTERKVKKKSYWVWTRGEPPARGFGPGEKFYRPGVARAVSWRDALKILGAEIQVVSSTPDKVDGAHVLDGTVVFDCALYESGVVVEVLRCNCTQAEFEEVLRNGDDSLIRQYLSAPASKAAYSQGFSWR